MQFYIISQSLVSSPHSDAHMLSATEDAPSTPAAAGTNWAEDPTFAGLVISAAARRPAWVAGEANDGVTRLRSILSSLV